jgi:hypothetical protein
LKAFIKYSRIKAQGTLPLKQVKGSGFFTSIVLVTRIPGLLVLLAAARPLHQLVALLVHQQLALVALEALATQTPDTVAAKSTERSLKIAIIIN